MVDDIRPKDKRPAQLVKKKPVATKQVQDEPAFVPPEEIHDNDPKDSASDNPPEEEMVNIPNFGKDAVSKNQTKKPHPIMWAKNKWGKLSKKGKIITIILILLFLGGGGVGAVKLWPKAKPTPVVIEKKQEEPPKPTTEASNLTGLQVGFEVNKLPVTAVMIENSPDARPQAGLNEAGVVFEAVAEGGITRFLALFQDNKPAHVGPIRSSRPYYIRWLLPFNANYVHAGGSPEALQDIRTLGVRDVDHGANGGAFDRVKNRYAPHNLYSSLDRLISAGNGRGYGASIYTGFPRKTETKLEIPTAKAINLNISSALYNVHYAYDTTNNSYLRNLAGQPHTDEKSGQQINVKVVVAVITDKGIHPDRVHTSYRTTGSGAVVIFQDGGVTQGTWTKADDKAQIIFKDTAGTEIKLNPGQTWITMVGNSGAVTFTP